MTDDYESWLISKWGYQRLVNHLWSSNGANETGTGHEQENRVLLKWRYPNRWMFLCWKILGKWMMGGYPTPFQETSIPVIIPLKNHADLQKWALEQHEAWMSPANMWKVTRKNGENHREKDPASTLTKSCAVLRAARSPKTRLAPPIQQRRSRLGRDFTNKLWGCQHQKSRYNWITNGDMMGRVSVS